MFLSDELQVRRFQSRAVFLKKEVCVGVCESVSETDKEKGERDILTLIVLLAWC